MHNAQRHKIYLKGLTQKRGFTSASPKVFKGVRCDFILQKVVSNNFGNHNIHPKIKERSVIIFFDITVINNFAIQSYKTKEKYLTDNLAIKTCTAQEGLDQIEPKLNFQVPTEGLEMLILLHRLQDFMGQ